MREITKGPEPPSLTVHRQTTNCNYDNYTDKNALRHSLATEQRGLCCYCMSRIQNGTATMKIEHWRSQANYPADQLSYRNLLGACHGGKGQPPRFQHCDTKKGDSDLQWNPADPGHHIETRIHYEPDGSIHSDETVFNAQLNQVLNLNLPFLKNNRKAILDAVLDWWKGEQARIHGPVPSERFVRQRDRYVAGNGDLDPHRQVAVWWLGQRIARMKA
jgi:uncharacterized protein (TIGR02646 family)